MVIDGPAQTLSLYLDGVALGTEPTLQTSQSALNDVNDWIGRSQFVADEEFQGSIDELRIHGAARTPEQIAASAAAGPDALPEE